ncbi:MAG TPA: hypothetical protein VFJ61_03925 [Solirubrobacterales bacterium]|nr:hypothetical protein [Solirubrobacterales bacterium]
MVAAIATAAAVAGPVVSGPDGNTQSIDSLIGPKKLSKKTFTPATLSVTTLTTSTTAANGVPSPAIRATIDFDKNAVLFTKGLPTCDPAKLQSQSTEVAEQVCGKAKIGGGKAIALLPVGSRVYDVEQTVTAFNGQPKGGKPVVILHTYGTTPLQTTLVLVGTVSNYAKQGYGPRLDLEIPLLAGGSGALKEFQVTIKKQWRYKGQRRSFVSAKCPNSKKLKARGAFTYRDGQSLTALSTQTCKQAA